LFPARISRTPRRPSSPVILEPDHGAGFEPLGVAWKLSQTSQHRPVVKSARRRTRAAAATRGSRSAHAATCSCAGCARPRPARPSSPAPASLAPVSAAWRPSLSALVTRWLSCVESSATEILQLVARHGRHREALHVFCIWAWPTRRRVPRRSRCRCPTARRARAASSTARTSPPRPAAPSAPS
jgi:hypothetical protein